MRLPRRVLRDVVMIALGALLVGAGAWAAERVALPGRPPVETLRPTGVGLPDIGVGGTTATADYVAAVRRYESSGRYGRDVRTMIGRARGHLERRLAARRACRGTPRRRGCRALVRARPALVLDVDETSLSNYDALARAGFSNYVAAVTPGIAASTNAALRPTVDLARLARRRGVAVFFITGRPTALREPTARNLRRAGYPSWQGLVTKGSDSGTVAYKSGARRAIERRGFRILANVGDQDSDLAGGFAERAFKLPNPFYFVP